MTVKQINAKTVAKWYMNGLWSADMVNDAVIKGHLTRAEADKIVKLPVRG